MTKGKVVLVPFPFDDLSTLKVRPSRIDAELNATDILLDPTQPDFASTGLKVPSTLKLHRVITITAALIRRELGVLSPAQQTQADTRLRRLYGL